MRCPGVFSAVTAALVIPVVLGCGARSGSDPDAPADGPAGDDAWADARGGDDAAIDATIAAPDCGLTDGDAHPPPTSGPFAYAPPGGFSPGGAGFPAAGDSFVDPVFGCTVRRLTDVAPGWGNSLIYSKNGFWNADATRYASNPNAMGQVDVVDADTGAVVRANVPFGAEGTFSPVDPDVFYTFAYLGAELREYHVSTGTGAVIHTAPAALQSLGGSVDWIDRTGRYFLLNYGGALHVWDRVDDALYTGTVPATFGNGWAGLTPDGNYIVIGGHNGQEFEHWSFAIDHAARTVAATGVMFWSLCGPHSDIATASDGKSYLVGFNCWDQPEVYRVDITIPQTTGDIAKQKADNVRLFGNDWLDSGHFSCASTGPNRDWCFGEIASGDDTFGDMGAWRPYKQEIVAVHLVAPFEVRRLAHHRSRSPFSNYVRQPRANASWDGTRIAFASDFGLDTGSAVAYSDIYYVDLR